MKRAKLLVEHQQGIAVEWSTTISMNRVAEYDMHRGVDLVDGCSTVAISAFRLRSKKAWMAKLVVQMACSPVPESALVMHKLGMYERRVAMLQHVCKF
jgi:hypothetical protein